MVFEVYLKNLRKYWLVGIIPPILLSAFIPLIASLWPELKKAVSAFEDILHSPFYQGLLGQLGIVDFSTWQGMYFMYVFIWLEMIMIFITIVIPLRLLTTEVDSKTLDMVLSYPIPRWRYLLEKFSVYLTYNILFPLLIMIVTYFSTEFLDEEMDYEVLFYAVMGVWLLFFAFGSISLLCGTIFLETNKSTVAAAVVILGQYILDRFGGIVQSVNFLQNYSLFHYLNAGGIAAAGEFPLDEFFVVIAVGLITLASALAIFQKRELAY